MKQVIGNILCVLGLLFAILAATLAAIAFADAHFRCPGIQCSDALSTGTMGASLSVVALVVSSLGLVRLNRRRSGR